jgi:transcriptional regulator with XRE-family HTH domain
MRRRSDENEETEAVTAAALSALGFRLREARMKAGMTQQQLATKAKLPHSYIYELETGTQNLTLKSLAKVANAAGVGVRDLLPESDAEPPTVASIQLLCALLKQAYTHLAEFNEQNRRMQEVQANLVERLQTFADMGAAIERLLPPSEEGGPPSRKAPGKRKPNG